MKSAAKEVVPVRNAAADAGRAVAVQPTTGTAVARAQMRRLQTPMEGALTMIDPVDTVAYKSLGQNLFMGLVVLLVCGGTMGLFLFNTVISGAVVTRGVLEVESGPKKVQHVSGGIVDKVLVKNGDTVAAGQPLVLMDKVAAEAQVRAQEFASVQQHARLARLLAERDGRDQVDFSGIPAMTLVSAAEIQKIEDSEARQFMLGREERDGMRAQLTERISQTEQQVKADEAQIVTSADELTALTQEVEQARALNQKKLVTFQRLSEVDRELAQLRSRREGYKASIASSKAKIAELNLQILQVDQSLRSGLSDQIADAQTRIAESVEKLQVAQEAFKNTTVRSPRDGIVHELSVFSAGQVVAAGEPMMMVVPSTDNLVGKVRLSPTDIDQVYPGQAARVNFSAFDRGTTPEFSAKLLDVSPDLIEDPKANATYYQARVAVDASELAKMPNIKLVPGMPIEVFIQTNQRTVMSYMIKPLLDQINRTFR